MVIVEQNAQRKYVCVLHKVEHLYSPYVISSVLTIHFYDLAIGSLDQCFVLHFTLNKRFVSI